MKKTSVLGATPNPSRYSYRAVEMLNRFNYEVVPIGIKTGEICGIKIINDHPEYTDIHTISLYLSPGNQVDYYDYIVKIKPQRIIFNPGTENDELYELANQNGIEIIEGCTLVMLSTGSY